MELSNNEKIEAITKWQYKKEMHPLTCGNENCNENLLPALYEGKVILKCKCGYIQEWIPKAVFDRYEELNNSMHGLLIYLDDIRTPTRKNLCIVRNYKECANYLKSNNVSFLSLDHDLGEKKSGYDIVKFMVQEGINVPFINIHSANPVGRDNMKQLIERYFPETKITFDLNL